MKELLEAMNSLVFLESRTKEEVFDIQSLSHEILIDFFTAAKCIRDSEVADFFLGPKNKERPKSYIAAAMKISEYEIIYGSGFTPKLAVLHEHPHTIGFNCLGKAIILGIYLKIFRNAKVLEPYRHNFEIFLGLVFGSTTDHFLTIIKIKKNYFVCDTTKMKLKKLHGELKEEKGYIWYEKSPEKDSAIKSKNIVIQDFDRGILNAIVGHFAFLKEKSKSDVPDIDRQYMIFQEEGLKLMDIINQTPWGKIQDEYFSDLNGYRDKYHEKYMAGCLLDDLQRQTSQLRTEFDKIIVVTFQKVFQKNYSSKENKAFIEEHVPFMKSINNEIILFLEGGTLNIDLPEQLYAYLETLREEFSKEPIMRGFAIRMFKQLIEIN